MEVFLLDNIFWLTLVILSTGGLIWTFARAGQVSLSPQDATLAFNRDGAIFVDVRPAAEFQSGHITQAKNIPASELDQKIETLNKYRQKTVIVVCQNGMRGRAALQKLQKENFTQARILAGGMAGWLEAQLPLSTKKENS